MTWLRMVERVQGRPPLEDQGPRSRYRSRLPRRYIAWSKSGRQDFITGAGELALERALPASQ
jgi:hypothetical protein